MVSWMMEDKILDGLLVGLMDGWLDKNTLDL